MYGTGGDNIHIGGDAPDANINLNIHHNRRDHSSTGWKQIIIIRGGGEPQQNLKIEYNLLLGREGTFSGRTECENGTSNGIVPIGIDGGVIQYNVIRNTMRGVLAQSIDEPCSNILIAYNTMENNCFSAVQFGPGNDIELYNNVMTYSSLSGYESSGAAINAGGSHVKMRNNIIYNDFGTSFYTDGGNAANIDEDYNIFYPASSIALGANSDIVDPLFVDAPNYDVHLQGNSSAINAGVDVGLTQDLDQNSIVGTPDIGAYEYQGTVASDEIQKIKVSDNDHFLVKEDGTPFFYLGDTAWELFRMTTREEATAYLETRKDQGFTVIMACSHGVERSPYDLEVANRYGYEPFTNQDFDTPRVVDGNGNDYWDHVDYVLDEAERLGLYVAFLPYWARDYAVSYSCNGVRCVDEDTGYTIGYFFGERYGSRNNLIWVIGGRE
jgi:hypothetical protein